MKDTTMAVLIVSVLAVAVIVLSLGLATIISDHKLEYLKEATAAGLQECRLPSGYTVWQREC